MPSKTKRPQTPKPRRTGPNPAYVEAMQGKRFSNAAGRHKMATDYNRKPKYKGQWED